jgi:hypothetical protein
MTEMKFLPSACTIVGVEEAMIVDEMEVETVCCGAGESLPNSTRCFLRSSSRLSRTALTIFSSSSIDF